MNELQDAFDAVLESVASFVPKASHETELTGFHAIAAPGWQNELMVVGRAVNGWEGEGWSPGSAASAEWRRDRATTLRSVKFSGLAMESGELAARWDDSLYNPRNSAFWRVVRRVAMELLPHDGNSWANRLVWSNLYKVSPFEQGNPLPRLRAIQQPSAAKLLQTEIQFYRPRWVLLLTGLLNWAEPFLKELKGIRKGAGTGAVQWQGLIPLADGTECPAVVGPHPQGYRGGEDAIVRSLVAGLRSLD